MQCALDNIAYKTLSQGNYFLYRICFILSAKDQPRMIGSGSPSSKNQAKAIHYNAMAGDKIFFASIIRKASTLTDSCVT
jgi:hypothetical protein